MALRVNLGSNIEILIELYFQETHLRSTAPSTNSVRITVVRWYAMTDQASYLRLLRLTILESIKYAGIESSFSKYAKNGG